MLTSNPIHVVALCGSLRRGSYNAATLRAAQEVAPENMTIEIVSVAGIPMFDEDTEHAGWPPSVLDVAARVAAADALVVATPEYNHSFSAAIKNVLDWLSRTPPGAERGQDVLARKPVAVLGASSGRSGSGRAQLHLRQTLSYLDMLAVNQPEVLIDRAQEKFDEQGRLTDEPTRAVIASLLEALAAWVGQVGGQEHSFDIPAMSIQAARLTPAGAGPSYAVAGDNYVIKARAADTGGAYAAFEFYIPPGGGPPPHLHEREYEGFYLLEGELTFHVGPERTEVSARTGDFVAAPLGVLHQFTNNSQAPARAFVICAPAGVEDYFAAAGEPVPEGSHDTHPASAAEIARLIELGPRWGIRIEALADNGTAGGAQGTAQLAELKRNA